MPRRIARRRRAPSDLSPALRQFLLEGWTLTGDEPTPEEAAAAWAQHGPALRAFWQSDPAAWLAAGHRQSIYNPAPRGPGAMPWYATQLDGD